MSVVEDIKQQVAKDATSGIVAQFSKDAPTHLALGIFLAVYLFCIHSLRVFWPRVREGELPQHDVDCPSRREGVNCNCVAGMLLPDATRIFSLLLLALQLFLVSGRV